MYKLIIADDDEIICNGLARVIDWKSAGVQVVATAFDGEEALKKIKLFHPEIVILDITMPFVSGLELAKLLNSEYADIRVILHTAYKDFEYARQAIKYHVFDFLTKPCHHNEVLFSVKQAIADIEKAGRTGETRDNDHDAGKNDISGISIDKTSGMGKEKPGYAQLMQMEIFEYIRHNYSDPDINLTDSAKALHISPSYLQTLLKKYDNTNFSDLLNRIRMEEAMKLLKEGNLKIYEVAFQIGLNSSQYFSRKFKKYYGIEPRDVQKGTFAESNSF